MRGFAPGIGGGATAGPARCGATGVCSGATYGGGAPVELDMAIPVPQPGQNLAPGTKGLPQLLQNDSMFISNILEWVKP
jgi:hypothetical protein